MSRQPEPQPQEIAWSRQLAKMSAGQVILWSAAGFCMLAAHAGAGWWVMRERPEPVAANAAPAIVVELALETMAPESVIEEVAADEVDSIEAEPVEEAEQAEEEEPEPAEPDEEVAQAEPERMAMAEAVDPLLPEEAEPVIEPEVSAVRSEMMEPAFEELPEEIAMLPEPRPEREIRRDEPKKAEPRPKKKEKAPEPAPQKTRAQAKVEKAAPRPAAAQPASGSGKTVSPARWQARLMSHLERRKRYPAQARRAGRQGVATVRFTIDQSGRVLSAGLVRSSGVPELDSEVVAMVQRASPVPAPPPGVGLTIVVPIRFSLR